MKIQRDQKNEHMFKKRIFENPKIDRGTEIHVTDLVYCLRKAYYRITKTPITNTTTVEYAIIGKTLHNIIENAFTYTEKEIKNYGITATIDILESHETAIPIEIKTTRMKINNPQDIPQTYLTQLSYYLAMLDVRCGYLAILNVIDADLKLFLVEIEPELAKREMLGKKQLLEYALQQKNPYLLPKLEWQCKSCEYREVCNSGK
jgi:CRISPR/Cas system-associated exonuclease Cas4 (RecB family)